MSIDLEWDPTASFAEQASNCAIFSLPQVFCSLLRLAVCLDTGLPLLVATENHPFG
jgi:hypothetical protein